MKWLVQSTNKHSSIDNYNRTPIPRIKIGSPNENEMIHEKSLGSYDSYPLDINNKSHDFSSILKTDSLNVPSGMVKSKSHSYGIKLSNAESESNFAYLCLDVEINKYSQPQFCYGNSHWFVFIKL